MASLAPCIFEALAEGTITLDMAKAYGAISDVERQAHVYAELQDAWYQITPDTIRRMVLDATVRGSDPRAVLVGRDAYLAAGGRIERELFDDDASESWIDIALLEDLAHKAMEEAAERIALEYGLAWVRPTLGTYVSHDLVEGLSRLPCEPAPMTEQEAKELGELEADYDRVAAVLEDEDSDEDEVAKAEQELVVKPADASTLSTGISINPSRMGAGGPPSTCSSTPKKLASVRRSSSSSFRGDPLGGNRHQHNLLVAGHGGSEADQRGEAKDTCQDGKAVALPQVSLRLFVREFCSHGSPPSARQQAAVGGRRGFQPEKAPGQVPVRSMHQCRTGAACLCLPQGKPGPGGQADTDKDMLREDAPGEGNENPCKLVDGPEADELRVVEPPWNEVPVSHDAALLS